ncbi:MAG TPA: alpha/beta hydrolase [Granulicella sp.]
MAQQKTAKKQVPAQLTGAPEVVDPVWLLKAIAVVLVAALVCGYMALCLLLYQGQWQLVLHPKQTTTAPAEVGDAAVQALKFGTDASGTPQLTGWWIPAAGGRYAGTTVLYLPAGDGSLADAQGTLALLHQLGVNVFGIDYRGYGQSAAVHPNQQRMTEDAETAFGYLTGSRGLAASSIVPYGVGVSGSLAAGLAATHSAVPAVIVEAPGEEPLAIVKADPRTKMLPVNLLLKERFDLAAPLAGLKTPKLLLTPQKDDARLKSAADPKIAIYGAPAHGAAEYDPAMKGYLSRFFDQYLHK